MLISTSGNHSLNSAFEFYAQWWEFVSSPPSGWWAKGIHRHRDVPRWAVRPVSSRLASVRLTFLKRTLLMRERMRFDGRSPNPVVVACWRSRAAVRTIGRWYVVTMMLAHGHNDHGAIGCVVCQALPLTTADMNA
jgi:hypothetical protein